MFIVFLAVPPARLAKTPPPVPFLRAKRSARQGRFAGVGSPESVRRPLISSPSANSSPLLAVDVWRVSLQGYPQALLPLTVAGIPSIHICLDFIPELLAQPQVLRLLDSSIGHQGAGDTRTIRGHTEHQGTHGPSGDTRTFRGHTDLQGTRDTRTIRGHTDLQGTRVTQTIRGHTDHQGRH